MHNFIYIKKEVVFFSVKLFTYYFIKRKQLNFAFLIKFEENKCDITSQKLT